MSPGNQMRALTANKARANSKTIKAGKTVDRKNDTELTQEIRHCDRAPVEAAAQPHKGQRAQPSHSAADAAEIHQCRSGHRKELRKPGRTDVTSQQKTQAE